MKNLRLKSNVKKILSVVVGIFVIMICIKVLSNDYNEAVRECVNSGNSYEYCVNGLD